jgi:murein DD-endopeptidase MepM/ murein hydrolase activator NlpD
MSSNRDHHASKKNAYSVLVVPNGETGKSKNFRVAPWQIVTGLVLALGFTVSLVLIVLIFTPIGSYVPVSNPYLENRYRKELIELSQRMTGVMKQLVELRAYNITLRKALGEEIEVSDSGIVASGRTRPRVSREITKAESSNEYVAEDESRSFPADVNYHPAQLQQEGFSRVAFPALMPAEGYTTRGFDPDRGHFGLDIAAKKGTTVNAAADGYVASAGWTQEDGYQVIISHVGGFLTFYKHNQSLLKPVGVFVKRGEPIALLGSSGQTSSGPHVHFEVWKNGTPVDPRVYLLNYNM